MPSVIFLDLDGVLNRTRDAPHLRLDDDLVARLRSLVRDTGAAIVLSTFWRAFEEYVSYVLSRHGIPHGTVIGRTPGRNSSFDFVTATASEPAFRSRAEEIAVWLATHPEVASFVILDDRPSAANGDGTVGEPLASRFVQTETSVGLSDANVARCREALASKVSDAEKSVFLQAAGLAPPKSHDPRGLVDTAPGSVNEEAQALSRELSAGKLTALTDLNLKKAGLAALPPQIGELASLTKLDISLNTLSTLPAETSGLSSLRILFSLGNRFESIPSVLRSLPRLYMLSFKSNRLTHIPEDALAPTIEWLILTDNLLEELPASIGCLKTLRKCMLTNNRLLALPDSLLQCRELELIRLADNRLSDLPRGFWQLPKLAWAGLAGNPLVARAAPLPPPRWVAPAELEVGEQIGAGGGGFVHRAVWSAQPDEPVALKLFRDAGTVTDGDPAHEIDVGSALTHPNVIRVLGATPRPQLGLVLELLQLNKASTGGGWGELGKPPNFDTCARDTYPAGTTFGAPFVLRALSGVAAACAHLHAQQLSHGDLYAHNTLVRHDGEPKVGDFGAAYNYAPLGAEAAPLVERVEVRAFGCLAEELATRLAPAAGDESEAALQRNLLGLAREAWMGAAVGARPSFAEACQQIEALARAYFEAPPPFPW